MYDKIIQKINSIGIFFEDQKQIMIEKLKSKSDNELNEIYGELCNIEQKIKQDKPKLNQKIWQIMDNFNIELEDKKIKLINKIIREAESIDNQNEWDYETLLDKI